MRNGRAVVHMVRGLSVRCGPLRGRGQLGRGGGGREGARGREGREQGVRRASVPAKPEEEGEGGEGGGEKQRTIRTRGGRRVGGGGAAYHPNQRRKVPMSWSGVEWPSNSSGCSQRPRRAPRTLAATWSRGWGGGGSGEGQVESEDLGGHLVGRVASEV